MVYLILLVAGIAFIITFIKTIIDAIQANKAPPIVEDMEDQNAAILEDERRENYDRQIDGYNKLLVLLDREYAAETNGKKKAAILSKQLATLEKLNKTIEKREKLE